MTDFVEHLKELSKFGMLCQCCMRFLFSGPLE